MWVAAYAEGASAAAMTTLSLLRRRCHNSLKGCLAGEIGQGEDLNYFKRRLSMRAVCRVKLAPLERALHLDRARARATEKVEILWVSSQIIPGFTFASSSSSLPSRLPLDHVVQSPSSQCAARTEDVEIIRSLLA